MSNVLRDRIQKRLDDLGLTPISAAERDSAMNRFYIYDFMTGKKASIPERRLRDVAKVLETTVEFLTGRSPDEPARKTLSLCGIIEKDAFRASQPDEGADLGVCPDRRYPFDAQSAYIVRGDAFRQLGIYDGSVVVAVRDVQPRPHEVVICRRISDAGEELTVGEYQPSIGINPVAVVLQNIRMF